MAIAIESVMDMTLAASGLFTFTTALIGYFNQEGIPAYVRGVVSQTELPYKSFRAAGCPTFGGRIISRGALMPGEPLVA